MRNRRAVRATHATATPAPPAAPAVPEWVTETPDTYYHLSMDGALGTATGEFDQEIELTREEYVALKALVAKMRGYVAG
jgi:hypothetical protein